MRQILHLFDDPIPLEEDKVGGPCAISSLPSPSLSPLPSPPLHLYLHHDHDHDHYHHHHRYGHHRRHHHRHRLLFDGDMQIPERLFESMEYEDDNVMDPIERSRRARRRLTKVRSGGRVATVAEVVHENIMPDFVFDRGILEALFAPRRKLRPKREKREPVGSPGQCRIVIQVQELWCDTYGDGDGDGMSYLLCHGDGDGDGHGSFVLSQVIRAQNLPRRRNPALKQQQKRGGAKRHEDYWQADTDGVIDEDERPENEQLFSLVQVWSSHHRHLQH